MKSLFLALVLLGCSVGSAYGYCYVLPVEIHIDETTSEISLSNCTAADGSVKVYGDKWVDDVRCERCECGEGCCAFGFGMSSVMYVEKDGERCEPVRTGTCDEFKFVKPSDPNTDC